MSIDQYNAKFNKSLTLDDVYGKGYIARLTAEEVFECESNIVGTAMEFNQHCQSPTIKKPQLPWLRILYQDIFLKLFLCAQMIACC